MKIYIINILPQSLKNKIKNMMESFECNEKIKYELNSKDFGLHILEDDKIYNIESTYKTDYEMVKGYNNFDLLIDKTTKIPNIPVISQLPVDYIITKYHVLEFFLLNNNSNISLILECLEEIENFEKILVPVNFYFNYKKEIKNFDLKDSFFQQDFNVFLSMLN
jgi:hypothetical protein